MWYWIFNDGTSPYVTCFDVNISGNPDVTTTAVPAPETTISVTSASHTTTTLNPDTNDTYYNETDDGTGGDDDDDDDDGDTATTTTTTTAAAVTTDYIDFIVQIPICYNGANYDQDTLINGANNALDGIVSDIQFSVIDSTVEEGNKLCYLCKLENSFFVFGFFVIFKNIFFCCVFIAHLMQQFKHKQLMHQMYQYHHMIMKMDHLYYVILLKMNLVLEHVIFVILVQ